MTTMLVFIGSLVAIAIIFVISSYNSFVRKSKLAEEAWNGIDIQLKKRYDLIPSVIETVKGYAKHEKSTLEDIIKLRNSTNNSSDFSERLQEEAALSKMVKNLFALAEAYPDLKSNQNFIEMQKTLETIEDDIKLSRKYYNATVREFNILVDMFPTNLIARHFKFEEKNFFKIEDEQERNNVKVSF